MARMIPRWLLVGALLTASLQAKPNVILIMADDLGYHDLACYGHPEIRTPVIDGLARDGVRLTSFYAGATVCTPSRMALLTGAYPARLGWTKGVVGYLMKNGEGLHPEALTIAELFRDAGYRTGLAGKWHLGDEKPLRPHRQGFEETYYLNKSNNQTREVWRGDEVIEKPFDNRRLTEQFTKEAMAFIDRHKDHPFFLYLPYTAPHFPVQAHPDWEGTSAFGVYGDVVEEMDARIGELLGALASAGLADNTIVVFCSDNGPEPGTKVSKADPYRGRKWSALEGGTRVPCILRWSGVIPGRSVCDAPVAAMDLLPTLAAACGIDWQAASTGSPVIDGVDVLPTLMGRDAGEHPRKELLYWHGRDGFQAIRVGDWKLFPDRRDAGLDGEGPALFLLPEDPGESEDRSSRHPEKVREFRALAERRQAELTEKMVPLGRVVK